jgi:hypothetical protein
MLMRHYDRRLPMRPHESSLKLAKCRLSVRFRESIFAGGWGDRNGGNCEGFRIPAYHNVCAGRGAGVRKPPGKEPAGDREESAPQSLWGIGVDKAIISRQPNFDERKIRSEFRKVIPNLKTVVVHCFDPRVTRGIPPAVAKALPGQIYPGEVFEFVDEDGKKKIGSNTTIFLVAVAGGARNDRSASRATFST